MRTIWKYPFEVNDALTILMPKGAEILTVQLQGDDPVLWAMVDSDAQTEIRAFEIHGTGNPMHTDMGIQRKYIGTFQQPPFVWHVFELL